MRRQSLLVLITLLSVMLFALGGCGESEPKPEVTTAFPDNSIVKYLSKDEGCQKLIADMQSGTIPTSCDVLYDEMGGRTSVVTEDSATISDLYNLFVQITVGEKTEESITDSYHHVIFTLQDGTKVEFSFESDIWCYGSGLEDRVKVEGTGPFWKKIKEMQNEEQ